MGCDRHSPALRWRWPPAPASRPCPTGKSTPIGLRKKPSRPICLPPRAEIARPGRPELLARLELLRCAAQLASLVLQACDRFEALRPDAAAPEQAYADYLAGRLSPAHAALP